ncbi:hypothetical protein V1L54_18750 [Streptomyces sp. TRM 70361]|uniref:hypothetical protein n=1 Tax=Streptomyces sp. TRM 70361 TaxID=3116553 RepID=UPI002E7C114E|nr:hypothetical protein [Streptomyces sp. TRM 70361]MEE1941420.1 hypothetical protein [Streptomyces sp. TRM 70361]
MGTAGRLVRGAAGAAALAVLAVGCSGAPEAPEDGKDEREERANKEVRPEKTAEVKLIGDGSTAYIGPQPNQPRFGRLEPGRKPPQFVVFSWDGAGEDSKKLFSHFRQVGRKYDAHMTYFLSGIYLLPESEADRYRPPGRGRGASDIGYLKDENIRATLEQLRGAWLDGSEIGTHFNGHFCGPGGVGDWSSEQWKSEIEQAKWFVSNWKTATGWNDLEPLPFDYDRELVGGRTPCLEGRDNLLPAAREMSFRYDSSGNGTQVWPDKEGGLWDLPLQQVPMPGRSFETLSMDYNFLANQSGTVDGDPAMRERWGRQMRDGLLAGFDRAYDGNRAPMIIGNHFEGWNGGVYMKAVEDVIKEICPKADVHCVSFRQLVDWLDEQDPAVLEKLRTLGVGEAPEDGWESFLAAPATAAGASPPSGPPGSGRPRG